MHKSLLHILLLLLLLSTHAHAAPIFGPAGNTPWEVGTPELFNINSSILHDAVSSVEKVRERYCLLIIKQGIIISETYYSNSSETTYETDSAAKTMLGLLIGAVWTHRPWDLDAPLSTFGVNTSIFNEWHDVVTTRHVLSQSSGMGAIAPGIAMTYDSDQYIQTLSPLMNKILEKDNVTVLQWAERYFAVPLGISGVFNGDEYIGGGNVSIGGGQRMTCRQLARVGQLLLNGGRVSVVETKTKTKQERVLVSSTFIKQMKQSSFPNAFTTYGFLTWLNERGAAPSFCCAPRWCPSFFDGLSGNMWGGVGGTSLNGIIGDDISFGYGPSADSQHGNIGPVVVAPADSMVALGYLGRLLLMFPSSDTVVVTMGQTGGQSLVGGQCEYDESYALSLIYRAIEPLLNDHKLNMTAVALLALARKEQRLQVVEQQQPVSVVDQVAEQVEVTNNIINNIKGGEIVGSCFCFCAPGEGYGHCFDVHEKDDVVVAAAGDNVDPCSSYQSQYVDYCPSVGVAQQCSHGGHNATGGVTNVPTCAGISGSMGANAPCVVVEGCPDRHPAEPFDTEFCMCKPIAWESCYYVPGNTNCGDNVEGRMNLRRGMFERLMISGGKKGGRRKRFKF